MVAQDGSGDYKTIQEAVNSIRDFGFQRAFIHIKKGIYKEKLVIPSWKTRISLIGEDVEKTIITWDDYNKKGNTNTFTSYTVQVCGKGFVFGPSATIKLILFVEINSSLVLSRQLPPNVE
ncbi:hypothetical protein ES703_94740 [subsurface metagenome]